ncbi:hypothetical protein RHMOL_Rhmol03G0182300 [Rhododendron molle]|uniref:Uncharacterized protein n=1 Tax=Rhododendron molle TaxID=49168 RepID=A0ACC0PFU8_RHOML|nr:hypothetical protein RHMOL_Rhmol03G0182300 [Rhododendron molle]
MPICWFPPSEFSPNAHSSKLSLPSSPSTEFLPKIDKTGSWLAYLGRIKTAEFLLRIGIIQSDLDALCKFCNESPESIDHLLYFCQPVWDTWTNILSWWGMQWAPPATFASLLHWWKTGIVKPKHKIIWESIPFAVIWTVWNTRNKLVFENKTVDWMETTDLIKARVAFWVTSNKDGSVYTMDDIMFRLHSIMKSG